MAAGVRRSFLRYVSADSAVHRLDPSAKAGAFAVILAMVFLSRGWVVMLPVAALVIALCGLSRVGFSFYLTTLGRFSWMFALSFAINAVFPRAFGYSALSSGALNVAGIFSARLALMVLTGAVFTVTTAPHEIGDSLLAVCGSGGRAGRKAADLATILSISLRFIPVMFEEAERIKTAQMLRGQKSHSLRQRIGAVVNLIVPLFQSSLRKAGDLGFALESRCYGYRVPRTGAIRFGSGEVLVLGASFACLALLILLSRVMR
jgi:energy-coupling factor transport system permease protein